MRSRMTSSFLLIQFNLIAALAVLLATRGVADNARCPRYCSCYLNSANYMKSVSCVARRLFNIDLSIPQQVQNLDLSNNSISVLEDRGFQNLGLIQIVRLVMRHNSLNTIGLHSFVGLEYLHSVDLASNNLYQIIPWTFYDNNNLTFVSLSGNPLGHVAPSGPFLDIPSLEVLELKNCKFAHFSLDAFSALPNLRWLDISHNELISIDIYSLQFLYNIEELDITKNPWPCNSNLRNLKVFLEEKSSRLIGSSCDKGFQETEMKPVKFEKMISVGIDYPEYEDSANSIRENKVQDTTRQDHFECNCKAAIETMITYDNLLGLPPLWSLLVSFHLGVCVTIFLGYFWTCCTARKNKYVCLDQTASPTIPAVIEILPTIVSNGAEGEVTTLTIEETALCPETPPPTYRELFMTSVT